MRKTRSGEKRLATGKGWLDVLRASLRLAAIGGLVVTVVGCMGYVPGRQSYWDAKVKEMCARDGGSKVFETVEISEEQYRKLREILDVLVTGQDKPTSSNKPYYMALNRTTVRGSDPIVMRSETKVLRRSDDKLLGRSITYWRTGGDFPTGISEASTFMCPANSNIIDQVFKVRDGGK